MLKTLSSFLLNRWAACGIGPSAQGEEVEMLVVNFEASRVPSLLVVPLAKTCQARCNAPPMKNDNDGTVSLTA